MTGTKAVIGKRTFLRWLGIVSGLVVLGIVILALLLPWIAVSISYPALTIDVSRFLRGKVAGLVTNTTIRVEFDLRKGQVGSYDIRARGRLLDWPFSAQANVRPRWRWLGLDLSGEAEAWLNDTAWSLRAEFDASSSGAWRAAIDIPETAISDRDPVVGALVARWPMPAVSNLVFDGSFGLKAEGERTNAHHVVTWSALGRLKDLNATCALKNMPVQIANLRMGFGASGIANHVDVRPMFPRTDALVINGCMLTNAFASVRATETAYLVTEAGAGCCGGELKLYSFFLDPKKLNAGVTLFVDAVDAGDVLRLLKGFNGEATGKLYGKIPLHLKNGESLRLQSAYLHSAPGEIGTLKVFDPKPVVENLALGGVPEATRANVAKALADLSYSVMKINLRPEGDNSMALTIRLAGSATHNGVTVPVSFEVTFHGDVEQLVNTGLKTALRKK